MALQSDKISEICSVPSTGEESSSDEKVQFCRSDVQDSEDLGDILNDYDSYWQDINDRLIISRLVSDSVIKGMVNAVSQDSAEMVAAKQIEVTRLKDELLEGQMVQKLQAEVEVIVMRNAVQCVREECERKLLDSPLYASKATRWKDSLKVVSGVCQDLGLVQNSLVNLEKLSLNGSVETDHYHHRFSTNHASPFSPSSEKNIGCKEPSVSLPENIESSHLKHLPKDGLYTHFRNEIKVLKIDHERTVQAMTDEYFNLKREFLREKELLKVRESFLPLKSKDFDVLRKKIPDVILKLNHILLEDEDFSVSSKFSVDRLDNLQAENLYLKGLLSDKEKEVKGLSLQVSEAEKKVMQHTLDKACLSDTVGCLKKSLEEANLEASVREDVYKSILTELASQIEYDGEENCMKSVIMQEILATVHEEATREIEANMTLDYGEFSNLQTMIAQEITGNVFQEVLKDMEARFKTLEENCLQQDELIIFLKSEASTVEKTLELVAKERHILERKTQELEELVKTMDKSHITEKEQLEKEIKKMTDHTERQEALISQINTELEKLKANLEDSLQQIDHYKDQTDKLTKELELAQLDSERTVLQERNSTSLILDVKDKEYKEKLESAFHAIEEMIGLFVNFELETLESILHNNLRLDNSRFQLDSLIKKVSAVRRAGLLYKQRLESKCTDLQKAEAEVDLLGDEVETLLSLLEKIYIALDHYSPILQHYLGIVETLKLIQRELVMRSVQSRPHTNQKQ